MQGSGRFLEGKLVRTGPDSYEVVHGPVPERLLPKTKNAPKKKSYHYVPRTQTGPEWYLSPDLKTVVDSEGEVLSTEVVVLKQVRAGTNFTKIFIRFAYDHVIWSGYTLKEPVLRLKVKASISTELYPRRSIKTRRICPRCTQKVRGGVEGQPCANCKMRQKITACSNPGCNNLVSQKCKYGLCKTCFKAQGAGPDSQVFNPFLGHPVKFKKK